jgi:hypothetical protein
MNATIFRDITVGTAHYGSDTRLPGMKYAAIARPPVTCGKRRTARCARKFVGDSVARLIGLTYAGVIS